jgi:peptidoglycan/LPS O-acetylase OafA/YrhL
MRNRKIYFDYLRIYALIIIVIYHIFPSVMPGGFLGVDIFFCLSGYLIADKAITEYEKKGRFNLAAYLNNRFMRIYPLLFLCIAIVSILAFFINKDFLVNIDRQIAAALGSVTNYYEIFSGGSYESDFIKHLFLHTWYLSIAIHEYIMLGLMIFISAGLASLTSTSKEARSLSELSSGTGRAVYLSRILFSLSLFLGVISLGVFFVWTYKGVSIDTIYFSDLSRAFSFFAGVLVASKRSRRHIEQSLKSRRRISLFKLVTAILLILITVFSFNLTYRNPWTYRIGIPFAGLSSMVIIYCLESINKESSDNPKGKANFAMRTGNTIVFILSKLSYGIYLFHFPLFALFDYLMDTRPAAILAILLSFIFSGLCLAILEPMVTGKPVLLLDKIKPFRSRNRKMQIIAISICLAIIIFTSAHAPDRTGLENKLWTSGLTQDIDQLYYMHHQVTDAAKKSDKNGCTIIGDSVTVGVRDELLENIPESDVDAAKNRTAAQAVGLINDYIERGTLRETVIFCAGTNAMSNYDYTYVEDLIKTIPDGHRLILVTPYNANVGEDAAVYSLINYERSIGDKYSYVTIADWNKVASENPSLYDRTDGVHFIDSPETCKYYVEFIKSAIERAHKNPPKQTEKRTIKIN